MAWFILAAFFGGWQVGILVVVAAISKQLNRPPTHVGILPGALAFIFVLIGVLTS